MIQVAAAIIEKDGRYLITQRKEDDHLGGLWEFPGGKKEAGETLEACLRREITEELACHIEIETLWKTVRHAYPDRTVELSFYLCRLTDGEIKSRGCQAYRWVWPHELDGFTFPPADLEIVQELATGLPSKG